MTRAPAWRPAGLTGRIGSWRDDSNGTTHFQGMVLYNHFKIQNYVYEIPAHGHIPNVGEGLVTAIRYVYC